VDANGVAKAVISTYSLPNGVHELSAAGCNAEGCAPLGAEILDVVVGNPKLGVVAPLTFNPARRSLSFGFTLPAPSTVVMTVRSKAGSVRTMPAVSLPAGAGKLVWNGRNNSGAVVTAYLQKTAYVDLVAPALSSPTGASVRIYTFANRYIRPSRSARSPLVDGVRCGTVGWSTAHVFPPAPTSSVGSPPTAQATGATALSTRSA
jgi:hypothetical protein